MQTVDNNLIRNLKMDFPFVANSENEIYTNGPLEVIIKSKNGERMLYDGLEHTIRMLPKDSSNMTEDECRKEFGTRLRKIMYRQGVTQDELSEMTGIPQHMISKYINCKNSPSFYKVDKIAKALGCSIDEFRYI